MSQAEKLDEIVRALESYTEKIQALAKYGRVKNATGMEAVVAEMLNDGGLRGQRALTLARELRDGAVEGFVDSEIAKDPGEIMSCDGEITVWIDDNGLSVPALLITDPTP